MMTQKNLSEEQIWKYLEELELEEAGEEGIVDLGEDVTITFQEVNEHTTRGKSSEDEKIWRIQESHPAPPSLHPPSLHPPPQATWTL